MDNGNKELYWILIRTIRKTADDWLTIVFEIPAYTLRHNPAVSREIMWKWRPPVEADNGLTTAKLGIFMRL